MAGSRIVERLLQHLDAEAGSFFRLWQGCGDTPMTAVRELRTVIGVANGDLEDDYLNLGDLIVDVIGDLNSEEVFELGSGILHRKPKYLKMYG